MIDRRRSYALVPNNKALDDDTPIDSRVHKTFLFPVRPKRRVQCLIAVTALVFLTILAHQTTIWKDFSTSEPFEPLDATYLDHLAAPLTGKRVSNSKNETTFIVGNHHEVSGNYPKNYQWIDPYSRQPFAEVMYKNGMNNNAMGRMPKGSQYDVLVVARGRNDQYMDPTEGIKYVNLTIVGFFANFDATTGQWRRAGPEPYVLDLPVWRQFPRPCSNLVNGGAADPRFIWSDAGEPLAVIGTSSRVPGVCKAVGLVDLRAAWPDLKEHLEEIGYGDIPIRFDTFTEIGKAGKKERYEKNWAPFFPGPKPSTPDLLTFSRFLSSRQKHLAPSTWPYFASQIAKRSILKVDSTLDTSERSPDSYVLAKEIDLSVQDSSKPSVADSACLIDSLPHSWKPNALHQATPFYRVTFCPRGTCLPSQRNTVLLGLIHYKMGRRSYRRMFVTMSTVAPFKILSVSPPLHFGSVEIDKNVVFSVSMAFMPTKSMEEIGEGESPFRESQDSPGGYLSHGWLDDTLVVGAGLRDEAYDSIHLNVTTALRGHTLCVDRT
ncbi:hypothetical protein BGZ61DRAFT_455621 [Ilyonectria robusta]|uniref:uncharacterized protein n=1 Tax=Ilyonectria robusta TaxID=1079257 RepID=UPI001E8D1959|nr:uncharacterized protein BGZ61DRAFT_455621 [Ilyonectria robusta]KAH8684090.1 hypothetical protein BGZ61DRAFT_455621 [Ilyonectria robusta]